MLNPFNISLRARGRVIRRIQNADRSPSLPEIVQLIGGPSWISEPRPGVMYLRAALIAESGATFTVAPFARRLLMADIPGVFLGASLARPSPGMWFRTTSSTASIPTPIAEI
jgi:hypothetical protein